MLCKNCVRTSSYLTKLKIIKIPITSDFSKLCSTTNNEHLTEWLHVKSKYTNKQLTLILKTLNKCSLREMKKFNISEDHIKIFESLKKQKKPSKSLDDFIVLNTLKVTELDSICSAISSLTKTKAKSAIITPTIKAKDLENINTVVGLRISANYVNWSQLELTGSHCNILKWDCQKVSDLPLNASPAEVIKMGVHIAEKMPNADAYVMEKDGSKPLSSINTSIYRLLLRHQQLIAIVLTTLSNKFKLQQLSEQGNNDIFDKFYMMKAYAPAQLFNLFFGSEIVSSNAVIDSLFKEQNVGLKNILSFSSEPEAKKFYDSLDFCKKEELNKTLLLTITFFESAVLQARNVLYKKSNDF